MQNKTFVSKIEHEEKEVEEKVVSLLDLPDLPLECILEHLSPNELCNVAKVCKSLKNKCRSDFLWENHMKRKWGKVFGDAAYRQWKCHVASRNNNIDDTSNHHKKLLAFLHGFLPFFWIKSKSEKDIKLSPDDSVAALYLSLENGNFWFPAQVYNREVNWLHAHDFFSSNNFLN